jgi:hypothetical protein
MQLAQVFVAKQFSQAQFLHIVHKNQSIFSAPKVVLQTQQVEFPFR